MKMFTQVFFIKSAFVTSLLMVYPAHPAIIIDHTCTDISQVPSNWIDEAKTLYKISYGHTSHGSQIVTGMTVLKDQYGNLYDFNYSGSDGALSLHDYEPSGDLGNPDRVTWAQRTRALLNTPGNDRNLIMWSWCGQVSDATETDINTYLSLMNQLEIDYPDVTFIYMTGHLDGTGEGGNLTIRNNQIRAFCNANNKVLFDFADIESYDPDGNYFLNRGADDGCYYDVGNWAEEWCTQHLGECGTCDCAHSHCLNCQNKGKAFWWMMASLAGWELVPGECYANFNYPTDLKVNAADLGVYKREYGRIDCNATPPPCEADGNKDGKVNASDLGLLKNEYGRIDCPALP